MTAACDLTFTFTARTKPENGASIIARVAPKIATALFGSVSIAHQDQFKCASVLSFNFFTSEGGRVPAPIALGDKVFNYITTGDERLLETNFDKCLFDHTSGFQNIRIMHAPDLGNVLLLDNDINYGESDIVYIETLCQFAAHSYEGKEVLIVGGGDGGVLHETLKRKAKFVTQVEIDVEVIKACRTHMRSVCGDSLDNFEGPNHKIIIDDCVKWMKKFQEEGKTFDFIINDLTDNPVCRSEKGFDIDYNLSNAVTTLAMQLLRPGGRYLARGNCSSHVPYVNQFTEFVASLKPAAKLKRHEVFVPSFFELYMIFEVYRD